MGRTVHLLCLLATLGCAAGRSLAAISVGAGGAGPMTFDTLPDGGDFSTRVWAGASADITTAAALNAAVQTNSAVLLSAPLPASAGNPPAASGTCPWSSTGHYVQTRPVGVAGSL